MIRQALGSRQPLLHFLISVDPSGSPGFQRLLTVFWLCPKFYHLKALPALDHLSELLTKHQGPVELMGWHLVCILLVNVILATPKWQGCHG